MPSPRERLVDAARASGAVSEDDVRRAEARREEYAAFGVDVPVADLLADAGRLSPDDLAEVHRGEGIPSRIAGLDVARLAGGTPELPTYLARRGRDGETFLVHACHLLRHDAPAEVDAFVRAAGLGRRLGGAFWLGVRETCLADGAYAAVTSVPDGIRLDERLESGGSLPPPEAIALLKTLAEALWPLEAIGVAATFPDPALVHVTPDGRPQLVSMEVLLAARGRSGDLQEVARSAARLLARLVGPERVSDPRIRDLLADLSSGRFEGLRPAPARGATTTDDHPARSTKTPVGLAPPPLPPPPPSMSYRRPGALPIPAPGSKPPPARAWTIGAAVAVVAAVVAVAAWRGRGDEGPAGPSPGRERGARAAAPERSDDAAPPSRAEASGPEAPPRAKDPGLEALEAALDHLASHRSDDPQGVIDRLRAVESRFGGAEAGIRAGQRRAQFEREVEEDADRRASAIGSDVERLLAADELGAAHAALDAFPRALSWTKAAMRVEAMRARVKEKAEALYASLRAAIDAGALPGRQDEAKAAFDRVRGLGDRELTARAEQRLKESLDRAAGYVTRRKALEADLQRTVGEALAAAGAADPERAVRVLEAADRGPLAEPYRDRLASARAATARVARAYVLATTAARARAGKAVQVATREYGAKPFSVTVVDAVGERLTYTRGGQKGVVALGTLDPETLVALVLSEGRETDAGAVLAAATLYAACGQRALADATLAKATALGAAPGEFAAEASAVEAWLSIAARREIAAGDAVRDRDPEGARAAYARAAATAPFLADPHRSLGEQALAERRTDDALVELRRARALGGGGPDLLHAIAKAASARGDDEALEAWRAFLAVATPSDPRIGGARAEAERLATRAVRGATLETTKTAKALLDAGKAAEAVALLEEAVASDPSSLDARRALARAAERANDPLQAYVAWRTARDLAKAARDATEAKEQMDRLERLHGERPAEALVRKSADESYARGEFATAADVYRRAVGMCPLDPEARFGLGRALIGLASRTSSKQVFEDGVAVFDGLVALAPDDPRGWQGRGEMRLWKGDAAGAIADATVAISKRRDYVYAYDTRARARFQALQLEESLADMTVVVTMTPLAATPRIWRAGIQLHLGRLDDAELDVLAALERNPSDSERTYLAQLRQQIAAMRKVSQR